MASVECPQLRDRWALRDERSRSIASGAEARATPSRERILLVTRELTRGGAAYLTLRHARALAAWHDVEILVTGPCDEAILAERPAGVPIHRGGVASIERGKPWPEVLHRYRADHRRLPPFDRPFHAVLGTSIFPDVHACLACVAVQAERRWIFLVDESLTWLRGLGAWERALADYCFRQSDLVLPVSRRLGDRLAEACPSLGERPRQVVYPPVDEAALRDPSRGPRPSAFAEGIPNVLTIARLTADKRIGLCLRIHHQLARQGLRFRWIVIGSGEEGPALRREIAALGMEDQFLLPGNQDDVTPWIAHADLMALFSRSEGCPTVVIEARALGCPVVMTDVNGADELIRPGETGLIVADEPEAITAGLARMVGDDRLRARLRRNLAGPAARPDLSASTTSLLKAVATRRPRQATPLVTILIPTYNQAGFLDRAIASALGQDAPSLEVVVLDDASTDRTAEVAGAWAFDRRFRYVRNERNLGRVANYRQGLADHARGDWALMLDGDDFLTDPGFVREACEAIARHGERRVVFAQAGHRVHFLDGRRDDVDVLPFIVGDEAVIPGGEYLRFVFETTFFTHLGSLYNRRLALDVGFYSVEISSSDMDSLLRLALEGEVLLLKRLAGCWAQHDANTSANLHLDDLAANVSLFRRIARQAVRRGLTSWDRLDPALRRYEAGALTHLFSTMLGKSARGPRAFFRLLAIALAVNPALFREARFRAECRGYARLLVKPWVERTKVGRMALATLRRSRAMLGRGPLRRLRAAISR